MPSGKAKKRFTAFLRTIEQKHDLIEKTHDAETINELLHELQKILQAYENDLPQNVRESLNNISNMTDISPDKITQVYSSLKSSVTQASNSLSAGTTGGVISTKVVIAIVVAAAVGGGGTTAAIILGSTTTLNLTNSGCDTLQIPPALENFPNVKIDKPTIYPGSTANIQFPHINLEIDTSKSGSLTLYVEGIQAYDVPLNIKDVLFDGKSILHQKFTLDQNDKQIHQLNIICG